MGAGDGMRTSVSGVGRQQARARSAAGAADKPFSSRCCHGKACTRGSVRLQLASRTAAHTRNCRSSACFAMLHSEGQGEGGGGTLPPLPALLPPLPLLLPALLPSSSPPLATRLRRRAAVVYATPGRPDAEACMAVSRRAQQGHVLSSVKQPQRFCYVAWPAWGHGGAIGTASKYPTRDTSTRHPFTTPAPPPAGVGPFSPFRPPTRPHCAPEPPQGRPGTLQRPQAQAAAALRALRGTWSPCAPFPATDRPMAALQRLSAACTPKQRGAWLGRPHQEASGSGCRGLAGRGYGQLGARCCWAAIERPPIASSGSRAPMQRTPGCVPKARWRVPPSCTGL